MSYIDWKNDYELGFSLLDHQHKNLTKIINQLHELVFKRTNISKKEAKEILNSLTMYANDHFETEERLLKRCGYVDLTSHKKHHDLFKQTVNKYCELFNSGIIEPENIADFLKQWLLDHIKKEDRNYISTLKSKGIT